MKLLLSFIAVSLMSSFAMAQACPDLSGHWKCDNTEGFKLNSYRDQNTEVQYLSEYITVNAEEDAVVEMMLNVGKRTQAGATYSAKCVSASKVAIELTSSGQSVKYSFEKTSPSTVVYKVEGDAGFTSTCTNGAF